MKVALVVAAAAVVLSGRARFDKPGIKRIETINASNLQAPVTTPYVAPGQSKEYWIYGPWVDFTDHVTFLGTNQTIIEKKTLFNSDGGLLRVRLSAPSGTTRGERDITIHIACPIVPFTDCASGNHTRKGMVLRVGAVNRIDPSTNVTAGQVTAFTVYGTGLEVASLHPKTLITNTTVSERTATTLKFTGTAGCGSAVVLLRDAAEGGDVFPYTGTMTVTTTSQCGYQPVSRPLTAVSCPTGQTYDPNTKTCFKPE